MAVAITHLATPTNPNDVANVTTIVQAVTPGTICVGVTIEPGIARNILSATIDYGAGAQAMNATTQAQQGLVTCRTFWHENASFTGNATIKVTFSSNVNDTAGQWAIYRVNGNDPTPTAQGAFASTDMDATIPLTTGALTIPADGAGLFIACTAGNTATWANATSVVNFDFGTGRHQSATSHTAGATTVTLTGTTNGEDGAMTWLVFGPSAAAPADTGNMLLAM